MASLSPSPILAPFQGAESPARTARGPLAELTHRMDIQRVHSEVVRVHVQAVEHLPQGDLPAPLLGNCPVGLRLVRMLDKAQQVLLVHAGSRVDVRVHLQHSGPQHVSWATSPQQQEPGHPGFGVERRASAPALTPDPPPHFSVDFGTGLPPSSLAAQSPSLQHQEIFFKCRSDPATIPVNKSSVPPSVQDKAQAP